MEQAGLLPLRKQAELSTRILKQRLDQILPWAMEQSKIDFWLIAAREDCLDPVMQTLYPWDMPSARRLGILAFQRKEHGSVRKMMIGPHSEAMATLYERVQESGETEWDALARVVRECQPKRIGVNRSEIHGYADGLSSTLYEQILATLGEHAPKVCSAEDLVIRWLQRVTPLELDSLQVLLQLTHELIAYAFSQQFIEVGNTTTTDLEWVMREVIKELGFNYWFGPDVDLQRRGSENSRITNEVIKPGDLLHCDVGINGHFLQLHTDVQRVAYVLREGESEAPRELETLLQKGNRLQDLVRENIKVGKTGNDVFLKSTQRAREEGLNPMIYTHPVGTFGHGAGPLIGRYDQQGFVPITGERVIQRDTCFALELNVADKIAAWDNQQVFMYLEEVIYQGDTASFVSGRQEELILV